MSLVFRLRQNSIIILLALIAMLYQPVAGQTPKKSPSTKAAHGQGSGQQVPENKVTALPEDGIMFDAAPVIKKRFPVRIPASEKRTHASGVVFVRMTIEASGKPSKPSIVQNTTNSGVLAAVAVTAAMQYKYKPAYLKKKAIRAALVIPFVFKN